MPISFDGDDITSISIDGDAVEEVTMDGDVVWSASTADWRSNTTVLDDFESYGSQAELESAWDFGVAPEDYTLNTSNAIAHDQDMIAQVDTGHAPNVDVGTPWGETYSVVIRPNHDNNSPGLSVQHQPNWGSRLDDCYWTQADFGNDELRIWERTNGSGPIIISDPIPSGLSMANGYRIQVDLNNSDEIRARLFNFGDNPDETSPISNTGWVSPSTVFTGGHIMLDAGREGAGNTHFDNLRQH